jgi:glycosyltransferase involved in cell wall biosynthesis
MRNCRKIESVAFVIPARNEERYLRECLDSVFVQHIGDGLTRKVIVVDNGSTDGTNRVATSCNVTVISLSACNPAKARNVGAMRAEADLIAFIDADCVLPNGWLENGIRILEDKTIVGYGSVQAIPPEEAPWVERIWVDSIAPIKHIDYELASWLPAFNLLVSSEDFASIAGFDENLETCEDSDFSLRLSVRGSLYKDHRFPVRHLGESHTMLQLLRREMWRSRGNLRSALKRGNTAKEVVSIFVPMFYAALLLVTVGIMFSLAWTGTLGFVVLVVCLIAVLGIPTCIGFAKFGKRYLLRRSILLSIYLIGRGIGPFWNWQRVSR